MCGSQAGGAGGATWSSQRTLCYRAPCLPAGAAGETKIGLSYPYLCQDVKPGSRILIGDGAVRLPCGATTAWVGAFVSCSTDPIIADARLGCVAVLARPQISLEVVSILGDDQLLAKCLNSKQLGERKNCNLPGAASRYGSPCLGAAPCPFARRRVATRALPLCPRRRRARAAAGAHGARHRGRAEVRVPQPHGLCRGLVRADGGRRAVRRPFPW